MDRHSFFTRLFHFPSPLCTVVALLALLVLAAAHPARCGEIHDAAGSNDLAKVRALLKDNPALVSSKDDKGWTPLHWAALRGHEEVTKELLAAKADANGKANDGQTPLHLAAQKGWQYVVELLLAGGADVNARDSAGMTPLDLATAAGHEGVAQLLRQHFGQETSVAQETTRRAEADAAIHDAAKNGDLPRVHALLKEHPDLVFSKDQSGATPLLLAAAKGYRDVAQLLLAGKADVNAKANNGRTPLHMAAANGHYDVAELLLTNKADLAAKDDAGMTPLDMATGAGHKDIAELLRTGGRGETSVPQPMPVDSKKVIQQAQQRLQALGYQVGTADGAVGAKTLAALKKFQTDHRLPVTGTLDQTTLDALDMKQSNSTPTPKAVSLPPSPLTLYVEEAYVRAKLGIYVGGGTNIDPPDTFGGGDGIPMISISNGSAFLAGELSSDDKNVRFLAVTFRLTNPTQAPQSFRIGDIKLAGPTGSLSEFAAVGYGGKLCGVSGADRDAVSKTSVELSPNDSRRLSMAFPVAPDALKGLELVLGSAPRAPIKIESQVSK